LEEQAAVDGEFVLVDVGLQLRDGAAPHVCLHAQHPRGFEWGGVVRQQEIHVRAEGSSVFVDGICCRFDCGLVVGGAEMLEAVDGAPQQLGGGAGLRHGLAHLFYEAAESLGGGGATVLRDPLGGVGLSAA